MNQQTRQGISDGVIFPNVPFAYRGMDLAGQLSRATGQRVAVTATFAQLDLEVGTYGGRPPIGEFSRCQYPSGRPSPTVILDVRER